MATNDGGPVFPVTLPEDFLDHVPGMSLRDWFAGMALQGMLANGAPITDQSTGKQFPKTPEVSAQIAYQYADAMLKERNEKT